MMQERALAVSRSSGHMTMAIAGTIVVLGAAAAIFAPYLAPHDPYEVDIVNKLQGSSWSYPLGTDHLGRCVLSRLLFGMRVSLGASSLCIALTFVISLVLGMASGYVGGWFDQLLMRVCDVLLAFPKLILALALVGTLGAGMSNLILAIVIVQWVSYARIIRGMVQSLKTQDYILAARLAGTSHARILLRHIAPFVLPQMVILLAVDLGKVILLISEFSFLGLGVQAPAAEWGMMINDSRPYMLDHPALMLYPGLMIFVTVMAFNKLGDGFRDQLDVQAANKGRGWKRNGSGSSRFIRSKSKHSALDKQQM